MALEDDIRALGARAEASLESLHDYYTHTKIAWQVVRTYIEQGNAVVVQNQTTGTST